MTPSGWVVDAILQRSLRMRKCLCTTPKLHSLANIVPSLFAPITCLARQSNFQRYLVSNFEVLHIRAYTNHNTCRFMAQRHGFLHNDVAIAVVPVVVEVRATETSAANADLEVCWTGWEKRAVFLELESTKMIILWVRGN
jgi:hypothetical protein